MAKASFSEHDMILIAALADKTHAAIADVMDGAFGTEGIKSTMAGVFAAAFLCLHVCNDSTPEAVADGVMSFNTVLEMMRAPFTLVQDAT